MNVRQVIDAFESTRRVGSRCGKYVTERELRVAGEELKEIGNRTNCVRALLKKSTGLVTWTTCRATFLLFNDLIRIWRGAGW